MTRLVKKGNADYIVTVVDIMANERDGYAVSPGRVVESIRCAQSWRNSSHPGGRYFKNDVFTKRGAEVTSNVEARSREGCVIPVRVPLNADKAKTVQMSKTFVDLI